MVVRTPEDADERPMDELGPGLRSAVEGVLSDSPPEDLMRRTLDRLRQRRPRVARENARRLALLRALAAAASIAVLVLIGQSRNGGDREGEMARPPLSAADSADRLPTLWAYHRASLDSPEALEKLLDQHADHLLVTDPKSSRIRAFPGLAPEML